MRLVFLLIVLISTLTATIDERVSDIYYGNGILTTKETADHTLFETIKKNTVLQNIYNDDKLKMERLHKFYLAYNTTALEHFKTQSIAEFFDRLETYEQLTNTSMGWAAFNGLFGLGKDYFAKKILKAADANKLIARLIVAGVPKKIAEKIVETLGVEAIERVLEEIGNIVIYDGDTIHEDDVQEQVKNYKNSIESGHMVIALGYGQGNLFTIESYKELPEWMQFYFYHLSVASPATETVGLAGFSVVTLDNDAVIDLPGAVGPWMQAPIKHIYYTAPVIEPSMAAGEQAEWEFHPPYGNDACQNGYWSKGVTLPSDCQRIQELWSDGLQKNITYTFTLEPNDVRDLIFQAMSVSSFAGYDIFKESLKDFTFDFYMGVEPVQVYLDSQLHAGKYYSNKTKSNIIASLKTAIFTHETADSQWQKAHDIGCPKSCDHRIAVSHKYDSAQDIKMSGVYVIPFKETGKLYPVLGGSYVKAAPEGVSKKIFDDGPVCHELLNEQNVSIDTISGVQYVAPKPTHGAVEVTLSWGEGGNDFDLDVQMPSGVLDVQSCMMEHFYVGSEYDIYPGRYPVSVTYKNGGNFADTLFVSIVTPGESKVLQIDTNTSGFNPGHVADIVVRYVDNKPVVTLTPTEASTVVFSSPEVSSGGGGGSGSESSFTTRYTSQTEQMCSPALSCGCMPCEYLVIPYVSQVVKGPLSGANIALYSAEGYRSGSPLYSGKTGEGTDLYSAGLLNIPDSIVDNLSDSGLYILKVDGGVDIDRNDDMIVDSVFTQNNATLHAVLSGADLKDLKPKMSILTEISYQIVQEAILTGENDQNIIDTLDDVARHLLTTKIYPQSEGGISHIDTLEWLPTIDKEILFADYSSKILPIIGKLQNKEDIFQDAYNVVYYPDGVVPIVQSDLFYVAEDAAIGTTVGQVQVLSGGASQIKGFELSGDSHDAFEIDDQGIITTVKPLDFETKSLYFLYVLAHNDDGYSRYTALYIQVKDILDAPVAVSFSSETVYADVEVGSTIAQIIFNQGGSEITSIRLEGEDSSHFAIDLNGTISTVAPFEDFFNKKVYYFSVIATNSFGDSMPVDVIINVADRRDIPQIGSLYTSINENVLSGTKVGVVPVLGDGGSPIIAFSLGEEPSPFVIDNNGTIFVAPNAEVDYEQKTQWHLSVTASNVVGDSREQSVTISILNQPDVPPLLQNKTISINKETKVGTVIANILYDQGDTPISDFTISQNAFFGIDSFGDIHLEKSLLDQNDSIFNLHAQATNASGTSDVADVNISLITIPIVSDFNTNVYDNTSGGAIVGKLNIVRNGNSIDSIALSGSGNSDFSVELDGTLRVADGVIINTAVQKYYSLKVTVNGVYGANVTIEVLGRIIGSLGQTESWGVALDSNASKAYIASCRAGLNVVDTSDINTLAIIGSAQTPFCADGVTLSNDRKLAYVLEQSYYIQVFNISNPINPYEVGSIATYPGRPVDLVLSKDSKIGYVATLTGGLQILNLSDPAHPYVMSTVSSLTSARGVALSSDETKAYVANGDGEVFIIEISNPSAPRIISSIETTGNVYDIVSSKDGTKAYIVELSFGLEVLDVSNPTAPSIIGSVSIPGQVQGLVLDSDEKKAFIADGTAGVKIIDISDPTAPNIIGSEDTPYSALDLALTDDETKVYVADKTSLIAIDVSGIDVQEKVPGILGFSTVVEEDSSLGAYIGKVKIFYTGSTGIESFELSGEGSEDFDIDMNGFITLQKHLDYSIKNTYAFKAIATNSVGSREVDIVIRVHSIPELQDFSAEINSLAPEGTLIGQLDMWVDNNATITDIALSGLGAENFVIDHDGKIYLDSGVELHHFINPQFDLTAIATNEYGSSNEANVVIKVSSLINTIKTKGDPYHIDISDDGTIMHVVGYEPSIEIIDITDSLKPISLSSLQVFSNVGDTVFNRSHTKAYAVDDGQQRLRIYDISNPALPNLLSSTYLGGDFYAISLSSDETLAYLSSMNNVLSIVDISNPYSPNVINTMQITYSSGYDISVDNMYAYIVHSNIGMSSFDIKDPYNPFSLGEVKTTIGNVSHIELSSDGMYAYVFGIAGLQVISVSDPKIPTIVGTLMTFIIDTSISMDGTKAFLAKGPTGGLAIVDISDPTDPYIIETLELPGYIKGDFRQSPDGQRGYVLGSSNVFIIDLVGMQ